MNLFRVMEISGSALLAERMRAEIISANLANAETTRTESGWTVSAHERRVRRATFSASKFRDDAGFVRGPAC